MHIELIPFSEKFIEKTYDFIQKPNVSRFFARNKTASWENHKAYWENSLNDNSQKSYAILCDGVHIGNCGVKKIKNRTAEMWKYIAEEEYKGKGIGKILSKLLFDICFTDLGLNKIYSVTNVNNKINIALNTKMGFKKTFMNAEDKEFYGESATYLEKYELRKQDYYKLFSKTYIIAEMSANHCGDKELAKKIIKSAKEIGADAIKVQTYTADTITINSDNEIFYKKDGLWAGQTLYQLYQKAYTPWEWQDELKKYADEIGIDFFSTPFDYTAVDFLESINVPMYKIASFEAIDYSLIKYAAKFKKPMIISVGISSLEEIQEAIDACKSVGNNDITILKCSSAYPAKPEDMNLLTIKDMIERFSPQGVKIGLSDHSMSIIPPITAVALGATVIEKHLTLDRALGGEDSGFSLDKEEFAQMVKAVRETEKCLGMVDYTVNQHNRKSARSLFVVKDIKKGEKFTPENIRSIRPSNGLHPKYYDEILGKTAMTDIAFGTPLKKEHY